MNPRRFSVCIMVTAILVSPALAQSDRKRIDPDHSSASMYLYSTSDPSSAMNLAVAKVSGTASWDRDKPSSSVFNLYIFPAAKDPELLAEDGSIRKDAVVNLARYTLLTFESNRAELERSGRLIVTGDLTVTYVERQTNTEWSAAYAGGTPGDPIAHSSTHEVRLAIESVSPNEGREWPAAKPDLYGSIATTEEAVPGLKHALRDAVWPIVVEDERCVMPAPTASADMRSYQGAICTGIPLLVTPSGKMPAWSGAGYSGTRDPNPASLNQINILLRLRLLEPKLRHTNSPPE